MKRRFVCCNSTSVDLRIHELNTTDWTVTMTARQPIEGVSGSSAAMPMARIGDFIYLAWRGNDAAILTYRISKHRDGFELVGRLPLSEGCCYLSASRNGKFLLAAGGENGLAIGVNDSGVAELVTSKVHLGAMAHCFVADDNWAYGTACRDDLLRQYSFDENTGQLVHSATIEFPKGSGPRHIALAPKDDRLYVVMQEGGSVIVVTTQPHLTLSKSVELVVDGGEALAADIAITQPDGKYLFATERGSHSIVSLEAGRADIAPSIIASVPSPAHARVLHLTRDGSLVVVVGFRDQTGCIYSVEDRGKLTPRVEFATGDRPSWILELE